MDFLNVIFCGPKQLIKVSSGLFLEEWATDRREVLFLTTHPWMSEHDAIIKVLVLLVLAFSGYPSTAGRVSGV